MKPRTKSSQLKSKRWTKAKKHYEEMVREIEPYLPKRHYKHPKVEEHWTTGPTVHSS